LQSLNLAFRSSQVNLNSAAVIADGGVKKSHVTIAAAHIWADNSVIKQLQVHSLNVTSIKAELMAIRTGLTPAMEIDSVHDIIVITNSIAAAKKILESKVDLLQNMLIPLASAIKTFLSKNGRKKIHFWYCPSKAKWPRHKLVDDQVKASSCAPTFPARNLIYSAKRKNATTPSANGKHILLTASKKITTFLTLKMKKKESSNQPTLRGAHSSLS